MKTSVSLTLLAIMFFTFLVSSILQSCENPNGNQKGDNEGEASSSTGNIIQNETIISFHDNTSKAKVKQIIDNAILQGFEVDSCGCGDLYLLKDNLSNPNLTPDSKLASTGGTPGQRGNGNVQGDAYAHYNIQLELDPVYDPNASNDPITTQNPPTSQGVFKIAIIDGGITHYQNLSDFLWVNNNPDPCYLDNYNNDRNGFDFTIENGLSPTPFNMHGTFISQIIVEPFIGTQIQIALMNVRIFDFEGKSNLFDALCAIEYAIKKDANIINISWGYYRSIADDLAMKSDTLLYEYLLKANTANIPIFASAGNDTVNTDNKFHYPSGFFTINADPNYLPNLISIAALDDNEQSLAKYTNYGKKSVFIASKGTHLMNGDTIRGTSYATPDALSYALILKNNNIIMSPGDLKNCINNNAAIYGFPLFTEGKIDKAKANCP